MIDSIGDEDVFILIRVKIIGLIKIIRLEKSHIA